MPTTTTITTPTMASTSTIERFLDSLAAGRAGDLGDLYAATATFDATVPNWRFTVRGPAAIARQYEIWFTHAGRFEELQRRAFPGGEVVTYLFTWDQNGVPHAAHHCHVLTLDADGRILVDQVWCGGQWDAALLARMEEAGHAG